MILNNLNLYNNDCLKVMKELPSNFVDLILIDPPYNIGKDHWDKWKTVDEYVDFLGSVFSECERLLKKNGSFYFFHNDFLQIVEIQNWINKNSNFIFNQFITWYKISPEFKNFGFAKQRLSVDMMRNYYNGFTEYCLYYIKHPDFGFSNVPKENNNFVNLRDYFEKLFIYINKSKKEIISIIGQTADHCFRTKTRTWSLPTFETYKLLIKSFNIDKWENFKNYNDLLIEYNSCRYLFNTQETNKIYHANSNVWMYPPAEKLGHLTPKPIDLLENIILHSTNEGDLILDCFMGSGSTGVAAKKLNRKFIGIEKEYDYFNLAKSRIIE